MYGVPLAETLEGLKLFYSFVSDPARLQESMDVYNMTLF